ncbi:MAG: HNH endonuclease [Ignavibacteria bacterium]|nr:HNH endonuclease [Ignavibacteria bacterium]
MKYWIGNTNNTWFNNLSNLKPLPPEVNFWVPSGRGFKALSPGCPFLFRLLSPVDKIAGVGFFLGFQRLPMRLAWETFEMENGLSSFQELSDAINRSRTIKAGSLDEIGCIILENPVFFPREQWVSVPSSFSRNIQNGKTFDTEITEHQPTWNRVWAILQQDIGHTSVGKTSLVTPTFFGKEYLRKSRPGQGAFRIAVQNAYQSKCAITGESTLSVLQAAHIQPVEYDGPNDVMNGLLLRSDIHILYDDGLVGITPDYRIQINKKIRDLYINGKVYYYWHGKELTVLPNDVDFQPKKDRLEWHMDTIFNKA